MLVPLEEHIQQSKLGYITKLKGGGNNMARGFGKARYKIYLQDAVKTKKRGGQRSRTFGSKTKPTQFQILKWKQFNQFKVKIVDMEKGWE